MKKYFFLLMFMPLCGVAQKWDVGINTGVSVISKPDMPFDQSEMTPTPAIMISAGRAIKPRLRLGLDVDLVRLWRKAAVTAYDHNGQPVGTYGDGRYCIGDMAIMISPSLTYAIGEFYFGGQIGYLVTTDGENKSYPEDGRRVYVNGAKGFFGGVHAGYRYNISRRFSLNAELRTNYFQAGAEPYYQFNAFQLQAMIGLRYSF